MKPWPVEQALICYGSLEAILHWRGFLLECVNSLRLSNTSAILITPDLILTPLYAEKLLTKCHLKKDLYCDVIRHLGDMPPWFLFVME